jgi:hypothetical protein
MIYCQSCGRIRTRCDCTGTSRVYKLVRPKWINQNKNWVDYPLEYYFMSKEDQKKFDEKK